MKLNGRSEHDEQRALFEWAKYEQSRYPELALMFAIPNAARRSYAVASYMRAEGLRSGVPDICLPVPRGDLHGLWIELKAQRGRVTEEQAQWLEALHQQGYRARLCRGFEHARDTILDYLREPPTPSAGKRGRLNLSASAGHS